MICGHCKSQDVTVAHVFVCSQKPKAPAPRYYVGEQGPETVQKQAEPVSTPIGEGLYIYEVQNIPVKVKMAVHGSGRLYALKLNRDSGKFEFAPGLYHRLYEDNTHPVSQEEAAAFGKLYGSCMICGLTLTNEESIELGIGPVCREKMGWSL